MHTLLFLCRRLRRTSVLVAPVFAAGVLAAGATAAGPTMYGPAKVTYTGSFPCEQGFDVLIDGAATVHSTVFTDADGVVVRVAFYLEAADALSNSVTGKSVVNHAGAVGTAERIGDTDEFTFTEVGHFNLATSPGEGIVVRGAGRVVFGPDGEDDILFQAGYNDILAQGDELFCSVLA